MSFANAKISPIGEALSRALLVEWSSLGRDLDRVLPLVRFDCEIDPHRLGLGTGTRLGMVLMYRIQALLKREFMQLVIARVMQ